VNDKNRSNDGTRALTKITRSSTSITKGEKADVVCSDAEFKREFETAKKIGPTKMSNNDLLSFCRGVNGYYHAHSWVDARPFFQELWERIDSGKLHMNK